MRLNLIPEIYDNLSAISKVALLLDQLSHTDVIDIPINHLLISRDAKIKSISVSDRVFNTAKSLTYEVTLSNGSIKKYFFKDKTKSKYELKSTESSLLRININSPYSNTNEDKSIIWKNIEDSIKIANSLPVDAIGEKNLIYYTVHGQNYVNILDKSLQSIAKTTIFQSFDVLIICDSHTQSLIEGLSVCQLFNLSFHNVPTCIDGVEASMNKLNIFDYKDIDEYKKIIFLDCDILAIKSVNDLFYHVTDNFVIYTVCNPDVNRGSLFTHYHGLNFNASSIHDKSILENIMPFNAGQFAFINNLRTREHFSNMRYFSKVWPAKYFFEQSFMNTYCIMAGNTDQSLSAKVSLANFSFKSAKKKHTDEHSLIHFIGPALDGVSKLNSINKYIDAYLS